MCCSVCRCIATRRVSSWQSSRQEACCRAPQRVEACCTLQRATSMDVAAKKKNKDKKVVVTCSKLAQGVKEWYQMFLMCHGDFGLVEVGRSVLQRAMCGDRLDCAAMCCNEL